MVIGALLLAGTALSASPEQRSDAPAAGEPGGPGLALLAAKALPCAPDGVDVIERAVLLVRDGTIEAIGQQGELDVPPDYEVLDVGRSWIAPGLIDLHCHVASAIGGGGFGGDINDAVYQCNPGLRASAGIRPANHQIEQGVAGGVTTVLHIPGSATLMGGQGVLLKTGFERYEEMVVRDPGSLKVAQADNPKRWGWGMGRLFINWQHRQILSRGKAYAERWERYENEGGTEPGREIELDIFRELFAGRTQISTHTQVHQVVMASIDIMRGEFGLPMYIDHGTFDGFKAAAHAEAMGVPAILGPRMISSRSIGRGIDHDGRIHGVAAEYQQRGHSAIGFNTDSNGVPQEELALQAAMGARYGFDDTAMGTLRGLTIVPAITAGIDDRVGSLEPGKDADIIVVTGSPADPRERVELVWIEGQRVYDSREGRRF